MIFLTSKCYDSDLRHSPLVYVIQSPTFYYLQVDVLQIYSTDPKLFPELQIYISHCYIISAVRYIMGISNIFKTKCLLPLPFQSVPSPGFLISIQPEAQAKNSAIIFDFSFSRSPYLIPDISAHLIGPFFEIHSKSNHFFPHHIYPSPRSLHLSSELLLYIPRLLLSALSAITLVPSSIFPMQPWWHL